VQSHNFFLGADGRLKFGYAERAEDGEHYLLRAIVQGVVDATIVIGGIAMPIDACGW
jgi:hypothetical protein